MVGKSSLGEHIKLRAGSMSMRGVGLHVAVSITSTSQGREVFFSLGLKKYQS